MVKYIVGIIGIIFGTLMVMKSESFLRFFGKIDWAERHLGLDGGTNLFYKLIGIGIIVISFMLMSGMLGSIFGKLFLNSSL